MMEQTALISDWPTLLVALSFILGGIYFVKDGHHRISVARAFGQEEIEARVTEWQVAGPLPWETTPAREAVGQLGGVRGAFSKLRRAAARL